jgi:hypothetical protein
MESDTRTCTPILVVTSLFLIIIMLIIIIIIIGVVVYYEASKVFARGRESRLDYACISWNSVRTDVGRLDVNFVIPARVGSDERETRVTSLPRASPSFPRQCGPASSASDL